MGEPAANNIKEFKVYKNNLVNDIEGSFAALTDRSISLDTAKKYNVKSLSNSDGEIVRHFYPYYIASEITSYKIRGLDKHFTWRGNSQDTGMF